MNYVRVIVLTALAMLAFAGNSILCRLALKDGSIDAASFTSIRLLSGALVLWLIVLLHRRSARVQGNWWSALALFVYAAGFSFAYLSLPAALGALLLFGAVQATMIGYGIWSGEQLRRLQRVGLALALVGLVVLLAPGFSAPPLWGSLLMVGAGIAWGIYSLRGKAVGDPLQVTAGNFVRTIPMAFLLIVLLQSSVFFGDNFFSGAMFSNAGIVYAILSGALASGVGYAIWYGVLPALKATTAASVQLSVPVITAVGGVILLSEALTLRLVLASVAILGGIALVIVEKK
ncbi:DMT family transporter [Cellvibrio sp. OA-2007]|uniref:DMT family transporter n=1 Tax=Cellvibrio sp. OA-2007 TaxID=529823 RepID=UPI0007842091|nr:DMT family transporter [Cellvibrio sp. OA-2007]